MVAQSRIRPRIDRSGLLYVGEVPTTLRVYTHALQGAGKAAVLNIDLQLAKAHGNRMATEEPQGAKKAR